MSRWNLAHTSQTLGVFACALGSVAGSTRAQQQASLIVREVEPAWKAGEPLPGSATVSLWSISDFSADGSKVLARVATSTPSSGQVPGLGQTTSLLWTPATGQYEVIQPDYTWYLPTHLNGDGTRLLYSSTGPGTYVTIRQREPNGSETEVFTHFWPYDGTRTISMLGLNVAGDAFMVNETISDAVNNIYESHVIRSTYTGPEVITYTGISPPFDQFHGLAVSRNLNAVAAWTHYPGTPPVPGIPSMVVWTGPGDLHELDDKFFESPFPSKPAAVSADGLTAVGSVFNTKVSNPIRPALWYGTNPVVQIALPLVANGAGFSDVSDNGEVAVGTLQSKPLGSPQRPFVWIKARGSRDLALMLKHKFGVVPPPDITLTSATHVSGDGTRIVGQAVGVGANWPKVYVYLATLPQSEVCYCNCDGSKGPDYLNAADILCFQQRLAKKQFYANCDNSVDASGKPTFDAADFQCFMDRFNAGCPE